MTYSGFATVPGWWWEDGRVPTFWLLLTSTSLSLVKIGGAFIVLEPTC